MANYAFTLPFAIVDSKSNVLMGQRRLIQRRVNGQSVEGVIPDWAGQWGLIGGPKKESETPLATAQRTFREQTGLNLADPDVLDNFLLQNSALVDMKTAQYEPFNVLCIFTTATAIDTLRVVISDVIDTNQASEGTLENVAALPIAQAREKLGPIPAPSEGWKKYLVQNYYGGDAPGQLNTQIDVLTKELTTRTAQKNDYAEVALSDTDPG